MSMDVRALDGSITIILGEFMGVVTGVRVIDIMVVGGVSSTAELKRGIDSEIMIDGMKMLTPTVSSKEDIGKSSDTVSVMEGTSRKEDGVKKINISLVDIWEKSLVSRLDSVIMEELIMRAESVGGGVSITSIEEEGTTKKSNVDNESSTKPNVDVMSAKSGITDVVSTRLDMLKVERRGMEAANVVVISVPADTGDDSSCMKSREDSN